MPEINDRDREIGAYIVIAKQLKVERVIELIAEYREEIERSMKAKLIADLDHAIEAASTPIVKRQAKRIKGCFNGQS